MTATAAYPCEAPPDYVAWAVKARQSITEGVPMERCPMCHRYRFADEACPAFRAAKAMRS